jgi:hypothetical protein
MSKFPIIHQCAAKMICNRCAPRSILSMFHHIHKHNMVCCGSVIHAATGTSIKCHHKIAEHSLCDPVLTMLANQATSEHSYLSKHLADLRRRDKIPRLPEHIAIHIVPRLRVCKHLLHVLGYAYRPTPELTLQ